jgi:hypothetical protein
MTVWLTIVSTAKLLLPSMVMWFTVNLVWVPNLNPKVMSHICIHHK